jgi:hypothetical protein
MNFVSDFWSSSENKTYYRGHVFKKDGYSTSTFFTRWEAETWVKNQTPPSPPKIYALT